MFCCQMLKMLLCLQETARSNLDHKFGYLTDYFVLFFDTCHKLIILCPYLTGTLQ
jgi:hypothetical protein